MIIQIAVFFFQGFDGRITYPRMSLLEESQISSATRVLQIEYTKIKSQMTSAIPVSQMPIVIFLVVIIF
jgi:hypothetical protein